MFYLSAIPAGLALTVMAIYLCMRSLNVRVDFSILSDCGRMIQMLLIVYAFFKVLDLVSNQALGYAFQRTSEAGYFWLEMVLFLAIPIFLLSYRAACARILSGCTGPAPSWWRDSWSTGSTSRSTRLQTAMGTHYVPKWTELASSVLVIAAAVIAFRYAVIYLDILPKATAKPATRWMSNAGLPAQA